MSDKLFTPCNKNATQSAKNVLKYLSDITYKQVVTGQHTQTMGMEEYHYIHRVTGKEPALLGFELLSYSPNINYLDTDDECMSEVSDNLGTLRRAWEWAEKKGLITFTWHWFSPLYGRSKAFYTRNTEFDASLAVIDGTPENKALISDIDYMAGLLRPFCQKDIPILWRPLHECEGDWFWWGAKGAETFRKLWRIMYHRFVNIHHLDSLIWVFNGTTKEHYPGDDVVDAISRDMYPPAHDHSSRSKHYEDLVKITDAKKLVLIGETGTLPHPDNIVKEQIGWASFMTWSHNFCTSEDFTTNEILRDIYDSPCSVTKENLPVLY